MSLFRSLYTKYEQETEIYAQSIRPWPAIYRDRLPVFDINTYALQIRIENQHAKSMSLKQLATLPMFNESRRITSKAGWTYYGHWKGITFHTLFSLFTTPHLYPWVRLETLNGNNYVLERQALLNYRILIEGEGQPFSTLNGGPLWAHCFDYYLEYSIPHIKNIILMQGEHEYFHPNLDIGFTLEEARVHPGRYYDIHHEKITNL